MCGEMTFSELDVLCEGVVNLRGRVGFYYEGKCTLAVKGQNNIRDPFVKLRAIVSLQLLYHPLDRKSLPVGPVGSR